MTVGYLLDLLIINEVRKEKLADELDKDVKTFYKIVPKDYKK